MASPNSRATFKSYIKRQLGFPVVEINVDDDQFDDRIDDALQYFAEYHYDGAIRTYLKHQVDSTWLNTNFEQNTTQNASTTGSQDYSGQTYGEQNNYLVMPESVLSVLRIFPFNDRNAMDMFDIRYQLRLNDLYDLQSTSILYYEQLQQHLNLLDMTLVGQIPIRFNKHQNRLYLDMDNARVSAGEYFLIECYRKIDPTTFTDVYNDIWLKKYATALVKKQWGQNLSKFEGIALPGGVTLNSTKILDEATQEIEKLEEESRNNYELPLDYMIG
jgi:hypothetical protein